MEKKKYISPEIEEITHSYLCYGEGVGHFSQEGNDEADANEGMFDDDDNNGFTPVGNSLWD